jgi:DNA (cytosine-5)-methyltransferase 1
MENVPRVVLHLPESIPLAWIGIDKRGELAVPIRAEFNTADYGVPQVRKRFLMGKFPIPAPTHHPAEGRSLFANVESRRPWVTLRAVLESLPPPEGQPNGAAVQDPNYDLALPAGLLTDHFHEVILSEEETTRIKQVKTNHPYMGRMAFPDDLDRPARTVVATQLGRETLVIGCRVGGQERFRRATVRECAALQSFPLTFQFWGSSLNARYRLAGDAVPPKLTHAIALDILALEGMRPPASARVETRPKELSPPAVLKATKRRQKSFPENRVFRRMIPGKEVRGCRVDLDNQGAQPRTALLTRPERTHLVEWVTRLYVGEGKGAMRQRTFTLQEALQEFSGFCLTGGSDRWRQALRFLDEAFTQLAGKVCDATTLQGVWSARWSGVEGPEEIAGRLSALIDRHFPAGEYAEVRSPRTGQFDLIPSRGLRVRLAAALAATALACELINHDVRWHAAMGARRYIPPSWGAVVNEEEHKGSTINPKQLFLQILETNDPCLGPSVCSLPPSVIRLAE